MPTYPHLEMDLVGFAEEYAAILRKIEIAGTVAGIGAAEGRVLRMLLERSFPSSALAREMELDSGQTSRLITRLLAKGMVERVGKTKRGGALYLTEAGRAKADDIQSGRWDAARRVWADLSPAARERFLESVGQLSRHLIDYAQAITIRDAQPGEMGMLVHDGVRTLMLKSFGYNRTVEPKLISIFSKVFAGEYIVLVLERRTDVMGGLAMIIDREKLTGEIKYFVVTPMEQGSGAGAKLLSTAIDRARAVGVKTVLIDAPVNRHGESYFAHLGGWTLQGHRPQFWCGKNDMWELWSRKI